MMMAAMDDNNNFLRYVYRGEEGEVIPDGATHITVDKDCTFVRASAFREHPNIIEVICHDGVKKIGERAFWGCPNLKRVIMPGVRVVEEEAFYSCPALSDVECGRLEIIGRYAFWNCGSLRSIDLPSARIVEENALGFCDALVEAKFGSKLERIGSELKPFGGAFVDCESLERITIPLKDGIVTADDTFAGCVKLKQVDLVEGGLLETISALQLEDWRNDIRREIYSINGVLPSAPAGEGWDDEWDDHGDPGQKARMIRWWITVVLGKINHYKAKHQRILNEAASTLQLALPRDILTNSVLPFLELPSHTFEEEDQEMEDR